MSPLVVSFLPFIVLLIYGVGCGLSQSLMSVAGTACVLLVLFWVYTEKAYKDLIVIIGFAYVIFSGLNHGLRPVNERYLESLRAIPLILIPLVAVVMPQRDLDFLKKHKNILLLGILGSLTTLSLLAIYQGLVLSKPATGFMRNPIYFAYNLLPACVFFFEARLGTWGEIFSSENKQTNKNLQRFLNFGLALSLCALALSQTRMVWLCFILYFLLRVVFFSRERSRAWIFLVLAAFVFGGMYLWLPDFAEKMGRLVDYANDPSFRARRELWAHNWQLFLDSPFVGVGAERNAFDPGLQLKVAGWQEKHVLFAHSIYLQSLAEGGLIGAGLFFSFWILLALRYPAARWFLAIVFLSGFSENIFNNSKAMHALYFYSCLSFLWARCNTNDVVEEKAHVHAA